MFSLHLSYIVIALLAASVIPVAFLLIFYRRRVASISRQHKSCPIGETDSLPAVSVIIYSCNDSENLAAMLPDVLSQHYNAPMEVIVVNDGSCEATKDIVERLQMTHSNLYLTFTPDEARNLSRRKLALTIGIKAARHGIVVLTNANCRIHSPLWLACITRHFSDGKDIVIGHSSPVAADDNRPFKRMRAFDIAADAVTYLSAAIAGHPYRGDGNNLAYRRDIFFGNKGFSRSLNLHYGDDDIFINEVATRHNTVVELSPESYVSRKYYDPATAHRILKQRYNFTARYLRKGSRRFFGFSSLMVWAYTLLSVAAIIISLPNLLPAAVVLTIMLALWIPLMLTWRKTMESLHTRRLLFTIPWMLHARPFYNLLYRLRGRRSRRKNFTWER